MILAFSHPNLLNRCRGLGLLVLAVALALPPAAVAAPPPRPQVVTSILPIKYFVARIGGDRFATTVMVDAGATPETYEPTPRQMAEISDAALFIAIGVPYERAWLGKLARQNPALKIVDCRPSAAVEGDLDAHVWTSPRMAHAIVDCVGRELSTLVPARAAEIGGNVRALQEELLALVREITATLRRHAVRSFLVYHPAWDCFARDYGLEQIAIEHHGKSPPAQHLARVIERARADRLRVVFVQRQLAGASARAAARELDARIVEIDPLAEDYLSNLRHVAAQLTRVREAS